MFLQVLKGSPSSAQWVLNVPNVFPIAPCFNPICFAQRPPLLTYIAGEKLHYSINLIFRERIYSFEKSLSWHNQNIPLQKNKKVKLQRHPEHQYQSHYLPQVNYLLDSFRWIVYCTISSHLLQNPHP
jgi:hypothetical protein